MNKKFGHYEVQCELGRGGMGVVYKAWEPSLNRHVAIKVLGEHLLNDQAVRERFVREAKSMAALNSPHIIQIYFIGEEQGRPYFAMEYIEGQPLSELLKDGHVLPVEHAREILRQACKGLGVAHDAGVIHRDIKPANIMITNTGQVKIADFGIARTREMGDKLTNTGEFVGTSGYLSPEVCMGQEVDARADIFSLGIVFYEMLAGAMPFTNESPLGLMLEVVQADIPDIRQINKQVDRKTSQILQKMIAKSAEDRYQHCAEIVSELGPAHNRLDLQQLEAARHPAPARSAAAATLPGGSPTTPAAAALTDAQHTLASQPRKTSRRGGWLAAATVFVVLGAAAAGYYTGYLPMPFGHRDSGQKPVGLLADSATPAVSPAFDKQDVITKPQDMQVATSDPGVVEPGVPEAAEDNTGMPPEDQPPAATQVMQLAVVTPEKTSGDTVNEPSLPEVKDTAVPTRPIKVPEPVQAIAAVQSAALPSRTEPAAGHAGGDQSPAVQPHRPAAKKRSMPKGVVVLAFGDPAVANPIEKILEERLRQNNITVLNEQFIPGFTDLLDRGAGLSDLRRAILKNGGRALVLVNINPTGSQELQYYGRQSTLMTAQLDVDSYDLQSGATLGGYGGTLRYTALNATEKAIEAIDPLADRLVSHFKKSRPGAD